MNKLTPREPTPEMVEAGDRFLASGKRGEILTAIWRAMHDAAPSGWQPIETAPKDGTRFLGTGDEGWVAICSREPDETHAIPETARRQLRLTGSAGYATPTHWMPLPAPPSEKEE